MVDLVAKAMNYHIIYSFCKKVLSIKSMFVDKLNVEIYTCAVEVQQTTWPSG